MPSELETVENILQKVGLESLTVKGIRALNKTAEEGVEEANPLFKVRLKNSPLRSRKPFYLAVHQLLQII